MKIKSRFKISYVLVYLLAISFICISVQAGILDDIYSSKEIMVIIGEAKPIRVQNPRQVKIGNPKILDVVGAGRSELLLSGLKAGETMLTIVDDFGQQVYTVKVFKEDLEQVKERVDILLEASGFGYLATKIGEKERKIFVIGEIPTSKQESFENKIGSIKDKIINLIDYYDDTPSVEIDVEVLEVAKSDLDNLGFTWNQSIAFSEPELDSFPIDNLLNPKHTLKILKDWRTTSLAATLNLLKQNNKARTLSRPKLVCMSGKEAKLLVGGEAPVIAGVTTSDAGTTTEFIERVEYGISLQIKPVVTEDDNIQVSLDVSITDFDTSTQITLRTGSTSPGFTERSAQTELSVPSGQTVFLAGMIKSYDKDNRAEVPFLGRIPFLGALFRNKDLQLTETEIVISLTPTIIRNKARANKMFPVRTSVASRINSGTDAISSAVAKLSQKNDPAINYSTLVQNIINSNIVYPQELRDENVGGAVKLSLHLLSTGELSGVVIMRSSGSQMLDNAAEHSVKRLSPFPTFPPEIKLKELWIDMSIVYKD